MSKHYRSSMFVRCPSCGEDHDTEGTLPLNVIDCHEGDQGQDVLKYKCPETGKVVEATVYRSR